MTRSKEDILDAIALLKAMTVVVNMQGNQNLFGDALNTIAAAWAITTNMSMREEGRLPKGHCRALCRKVSLDKKPLSDE